MVASFPARGCKKWSIKVLSGEWKKITNEGLGPGLLRGDSTFLIGERWAQVTATGNHDEEPWRYKRAVDDWCTRSQEREKQTGQQHHQRSRLKPVKSFQIDMSEERLHWSRWVCYSNRKCDTKNLGKQLDECTDKLFPTDVKTWHAIPSCNSLQSVT